MEIITPKDYVGPIMELAQQRRGEFVDMTYLTETRTTLVYNLPLAEVHSPGCRGQAWMHNLHLWRQPYCTEDATLTSSCVAQVVTDFFDEMKSRSRGYASMEYHITGYRKSALVRLDIKINNEVLSCGF